jgi:hypothetical protein
MRSALFLCIVMATAVMVTPASAGFIQASSTISSALDPNGVDFDYTITLTNSSASTDPVGTFWYSWVPGKDFMLNDPISEVTPAGWMVQVTHGGTTDGYAIQWVASSGATIAPGASLTFGFTSAETPAELAGNSPFYPTFPEETATLYNGLPLTGDSEKIVVSAVSSVPEPSSLILSLVGGLALVSYKRIGRGLRARV